MSMFKFLQSKWLFLIIVAGMGIALPFTYDLWKATPTTVNLIVMLINVASVVLGIMKFMSAKEAGNSDDELKMDT